MPIHNGEIMLGTSKELVLGEHSDAAGPPCGEAAEDGECNENQTV